MPRTTQDGLNLFQVWDQLHVQGHVVSCRVVLPALKGAKEEDVNLAVNELIIHVMQGDHPVLDIFTSSLERQNWGPIVSAL